MLAFFDDRDSHHQAALSALQQARALSSLVLPVIGLAELLVGAERMGPGQVVALEERIDQTVDSIGNVDRSVARTAARIRAQHGLRLPDALIIALGISIDADAILTADRRWRRVDARVIVIGEQQLRETRKRYQRRKVGRQLSR